jgi:hypothetical protein
MKEVKVRIVGDLVIVDYCSKSVIQANIESGEYDDEADAFAGNYYVTGAWDKVEALYVDDNEDENLVKAKGKYVKTLEFFHNLFKEDGDHPLPVDIHYRYYYGQELEYVIKLKDDEEFDIKKVQLVKSDYEIAEFPYFILCEKILYDGKDVEANPDFNDWAEYCPEEKIYNEGEIDRYVNNP